MQFLNKAWTLWMVINYYGLDILTVWVQFIFYGGCLGGVRGGAWREQRTEVCFVIRCISHVDALEGQRSQHGEVSCQKWSQVCWRTLRTQTNKHTYSILVCSIPAAVNVADAKPRWRKDGEHEKSWTSELIVEVVLVLGYLSVRAHTCVCVWERCLD